MLDMNRRRPESTSSAALFMRFLCLLHVEAFLTNRAIELKYFRVSVHVSFETTFLSIFFRTKFTFEWFIASVCVHMREQIWFF